MPNTGFLGWAYISGSTISFDSGVADKQVLFMSGSTVVSGSSAFQYNYTNDYLSVNAVNVSSEISGDWDAPDDPTFSGRPEFLSGLFATGTISHTGSIRQNIPGGGYNLFVTNYEDEIQNGSDPYSGDAMYVSGLTVIPTTGGLVYVGGAMGYTLYDTSTTGSDDGNVLGLAMGANGAEGILLRGFANYDAPDFDQAYRDAYLSSSSGTGSLTYPQPVYVDPNTPGALTTVLPTGSGQIVRVVGYAIGSQQLYFNPSPDFIVLS